jgi:hypothetical protein
MISTRFGIKIEVSSPKYLIRIVELMFVRKRPSTFKCSFSFSIKIEPSTNATPSKKQ